MGKKLRSLLGSGTENTAAVLATAQHWEALRSAFHQHYGRNQLADDCFQLSQKYELELSNHLDRINKGENPSPGSTPPRPPVSSGFTPAR